MAISIKNIRNGFPGGKTDIRVDRVSVLGNPVRLTCESQRSEVCEKYDAYFRLKVNESSPFKAEVNRLTAIYKQHGELNLYCWCAPKQCHAETIKDYILQSV